MPKKNKAQIDHDSNSAGPAATGEMLRALLQNCPVCEKNHKGHSFAQVASTIVNDPHKPIMASLLGSVKQHEWGRLVQFKEWNAQADNLVVYVIKGDHQDGTILVIKSVFELYASNDLILVERVTDAEIAAISSYLLLEWQQM